MARPIPPGRFEALVAAGTETFVAHGYRRTQMQDVADALGVAKGTVYATVSGKEALLLACVRYADGIEPAPGMATWPLPAPADGELLALVTGRLAEVGELALHGLADAEPGPPAAEIELIVTDLVRRLTRHRRAIKLVDRCAPEIPELGQLWFGAGRSQLVGQLRDYLALRAEQGRLAPVADPAAWEVLARTVVETCVLWAVHLPWDPAPPSFRSDASGDDVARVLASLFATGLVAR